MAGFAITRNAFVCVFSTLLAFIMASCNQGTSRDSGVTILSVDIDKNLSEGVSIYDYCEKVEILRLDSSIAITNGGTFSPNHMAVTESNLYILDEKTNDIIVYDIESGKHLSHVVKKGRGPGEFLLAYGIEYIEDDNTLDVLDPRGMIIRYDLSAHFDKYLVYDLSNRIKSIGHFRHIGHGQYLLFCKYAKNQIKLYDSRSDELKDFDYEAPEWLLTYSTPVRPFFEHAGRWYYYEGATGEIFSLDLNHATLDRAFEWDFHRRQFHKGMLPKRKDAYYYSEFKRSITDRFVTPFLSSWRWNDLLFAKVVYRSKLVNIMVDLNAGRSVAFEKNKEGTYFVDGLLKENVLYSLVSPDLADMAIDESMIEKGGPVLLKYTFRRDE